MAVSKLDVLLWFIIALCTAFFIAVIVACLFFLADSINQGYGVVLFDNLSKGHK